jgi:hypothetical protein
MTLEEKIEKRINNLKDKISEFEKKREEAETIKNKYWYDCQIDEMEKIKAILESLLEEE